MFKNLIGKRAQKEPKKRLPRDVLVRVIAQYITPASGDEMSPLEAAKGAVEMLEVLGVLDFEKVSVAA